MPTSCKPVLFKMFRADLKDFTWRAGKNSTLYYVHNRSVNYVQRGLNFSAFILKNLTRFIASKIRKKEQYLLSDQYLKMYRVKNILD